MTQLFPRPAVLAAIALALAGLAGAVAAQQSVPMTPEEFGDYAEGYTLYFEKNGQPWGSESFDSEGGVIWRYPTGECLPGVWTGHDGLVCFYYGPGTEVLCWAMWREEDRMGGILMGDGEDAGLELEITRRDKVPVLCGSGTDL